MTVQATIFDVIEKRKSGKLPDTSLSELGRARDITGLKFGRLLVLAYAGRSKNGVVNYWLCKCDCGKIKKVDGRLSRGEILSCGCLQLEVVSKGKHGHCRENNVSPEFVAWQNIKNRCYRKSNRQFNNYGGRGIKVCDRWINSFENFLSDMGHKPSPKHTLDRFPDNDGNYEPGNCRWATRVEQQRNTSRNKWVVYNGAKMLISDFRDLIGCARTNNITYFLTRGWSLEKIALHYKKIRNPAQK